MRKLFTLLALCLTTVFAAQAGVKKVYTEYLKNTLTYYYDDQYFDTDVRPGNVEFYNPVITEELEIPTRFKGYSNLVGKVVFDASMKDAELPTTRVMFCGYDDEKDEPLPLMAMLSIEGLDNLNTASTVDMASMFAYCFSISELDLSGLNTENVNNMTAMFVGCMNLKSLNLSGWNTQNVQIMNSMFMMCPVLETLDLSSFNTENVTDMADMFAGCEALKSITFGENFKTDKVTTMESMFYNCGLISLDLRGFNTENVEYMSNMFEGCENLTSIKFGKKFKANYSYRSLFKGCTALKELNLTGFDVSSVSNMNEMFANCSSLESIYCDNDWSKEATSLTKSNEMFYGCTKLVGGKGTKYDSEKTGVEYAHLDVDGNPGYFTEADDTGTAKEELKEWIDIATAMVKYMDGDAAAKKIMTDAIAEATAIYEYESALLAEVTAATDATKDAVANSVTDFVSLFKGWYSDKLFEKVKEYDFAMDDNTNEKYTLRYNAAQEVQKLQWDTEKSYKNNIEALETAAEAIVKDLDDALKILKEKDDKEKQYQDKKQALQNAITQLNLCSMYLTGDATNLKKATDAIAAAQAVYNNTAATEDELVAATNAANDVCAEVAPAAFSVILEQYKPEILNAFELLKKSGDSDACLKIVDDAIKEVNDWFEYDPNLNIQLNLQNYTKQMENLYNETVIKLEAQRATDIASGMESIQDSEVSIQKVLRNGQLFILRDGKTFDARGAEIR